MCRKARIFWPLVAGVVLGDSVTKYTAVESLTPAGIPHRVVGNVVRLTLAYNRGAAMGLPLGSWSGRVLGLVGILVAAALFVWYRRAGTDTVLLPTALALLVGGALGNAWQRLLSPRGVIDFIDVGVGSVRFWAFNVADAALTVGVGLLVVYLWREDRRGGDAHAEG